MKHTIKPTSSTSQQLLNRARLPSRASRFSKRVRKRKSMLEWRSRLSEATQIFKTEASETLRWIQTRLPHREWRTTVEAMRKEQESRMLSSPTFFLEREHKFMTILNASGAIKKAMANIERWCSR